MSFDQIIASPDVAVRVLEGVYDDHLRAADRAAAQAWRFRVSGSSNYCPHSPTCDSDEVCLRKIAVRLRTQKAS